MSETRSEDLYWTPEERTKRTGRKYWVVIITGHNPPLDVHATIGTRGGNTKEFATLASAQKAADEMNSTWQALFAPTSPEPPE